MLDALAAYDFFGRRRERIGGTFTGGQPLMSTVELAQASMGVNGAGGLLDEERKQAGRMLAEQAPARLVPSAYRPPQRQVRGGEALYRRCVEEGYSLLLGSDGSLAAIRADGRYGWGADAIRIAAPLIVGFMAGTPRTCQLPHHAEPKEREAWTVAVGGALVCAEHAGQ